MPERERLSIGADVVEAAACAYYNSDGWNHAAERTKADYREGMEAAIREALDKLGLRFEREYGFMDCPDPGAVLRVRAWRLVGFSDWRPVDAEPSIAASIPGYANGGNLANEPDA
jgi:hypothetical protein